MTGRMQTGGIQDRRNARQEGYRTGGMKERRYEGQYGYRRGMMLGRTGGMQFRGSARQEDEWLAIKIKNFIFRQIHTHTHTQTGGMQDWKDA